MKINMKKLEQYLKEDKIMEFDSDNECMGYFNTYDYHTFNTVEEMREYQGVYGFNIGKKRYHINYDEALDVWENEDLKETLILNNRQHYFLKEIERLHYTKDEAYAEIMNNKNRFSHYAELEIVIKYVFDERPQGRMWEWQRDKKL